MKKIGPNRKLVIACPVQSGRHTWRQDDAHRWCRKCGIDWYRATKG